MGNDPYATQVLFYLSCWFRVLPLPQEQRMGEIESKSLASKNEARL
jgi:hypothetical protein